MYLIKVYLKIMSHRQIKTICLHTKADISEYFHADGALRFALVKSGFLKKNRKLQSIESVGLYTNHSSTNF